MNKKVERHQETFDLLDLLGLDLPHQDREVYYPELLQSFLFNFVLELIVNQSDEQIVSALQKELNLSRSPDEVFETLQELHPEFMFKFSQFVERQKKTFVINFLKNVLENLQRKSNMLSGRPAFDDKVDRYERALSAAQAENWIEVKNILNPQAEPIPVA